MADGEDDVAGEDEQEDLLDVLKDVLFYAPIGLILDAQAVTPDLAARGRQHTRAARHIGELAVKQGLRRVDALLGPADAPGSPSGADPESPAADTNDDVSDDEADHSADQPTAADHLAIPEYDLLAASQVVKRLDALSEAELEAVRRYESSTRDRRTILHKIARLQGG